MAYARLFARLAAEGAMIDRLTSDSRRATPGAAFFAYPGEGADGRAYIGDALQRGAAAVLWEEDGFAWRNEWRVPNAGIRGLKREAGAIAHEFYGRPSESLWMCGVTGTNGKTSCSHWVSSLLNKKRISSRVIGTLGSGSPGALQSVVNTTPDALEIHRLLKQFVTEKAQAVAMEVSSHGLEQGRVNGVAFDCALFTNLTQDHLDYHGTMEAYGEAKARLFETPGLSAAVVNLDDAFGVRLARRIARRVRVIGYGLGESSPEGMDEYLSPAALAGVDTGQLGNFNVSNALGVLGCLIAYGLPLREAAGQMQSLPSVPGRMERVADEPLVVVDYAHTPDALEKVLQALRPVAEKRKGRLRIVFGAGGDRDPAKRPLMGAVVARLADYALVTSDNPRGEDPRKIIDQISAGMTTPATEPDRAIAIERAILEAKPNDVVLVAGKGHESYQEIAGRRLPFSDVTAARDAVNKRSTR
jgi:UDP-N-acetylmuramoyl-L-alanyl-D-glutamate--2,6-diaminopimelate ligase